MNPLTNGFISPKPNFSVQGLLLDIDKFASHDGPGIRTTVFLKGCPVSYLASGAIVLSCNSVIPSLYIRARDAQPVGSVWKSAPKML